MANNTEDVRLLKGDCLDAPKNIFKPGDTIMKTLKLTAKDFKKSSSYWSDYIGTENISDYSGSIEIEGNLGYVRFDRLRASGSIYAKVGTGIETARDIEAGAGIKAGWSIKAGAGIEAGWDIKAGEGIEAGRDIEAGWGIEAGLSISCKSSLRFNYSLFAGVATWRDINSASKEIICGKLEGGTVCYGDVTETGLPEDVKPETISIGGTYYEVTEELKSVLNNLKEARNGE